MNVSISSSHSSCCITNNNSNSSCVVATRLYCVYTFFEIYIYIAIGTGDSYESTHNMLCVWFPDACQSFVLHQCNCNMNALISKISNDTLNSKIRLISAI